MMNRKPKDESFPASCLFFVVDWMEIVYNKKKRRRRMNYLQKAVEYKEVLLVGINYDKKKHHECRIERWNN